MKTFIQATSGCMPLADQSVQMAVLSPPYLWQRDYATDVCQWPAVSYSPMAGLPQLTIPAGAAELGMESTIESYVAHLVLVFRELWRVVKNDGVAFLNLGDKYANDSKWGGQSGKMNADSKAGGCSRTRKKTGLGDKNLIGVAWRVALALQADGWLIRNEIIWQKPNQKPENVRDRFTCDHETLFLLAKSKRYYFNQDAIAETATTGANGSSFTTGKTAAAVEHIAAVGAGERSEDGKRNKRTVWSVNTVPLKAKHFAAFPPDLIEPCILAGSSKGDIVLDPFAGAGTTALVAHNLGRRSIGLDMNRGYLQDIAAPRTSTTFGLVLKPAPAKTKDDNQVEQLPLLAIV